MLQDLINVGIGQASMDWFFRSAEHYVDVWERGVAIGSRIAHP